MIFWVKHEKWLLYVVVILLFLSFSKRSRCLAMKLQLRGCRYLGMLTPHVELCGTELKVAQVHALIA